MVTFLVLIVLAILAFYVTVFVVSTGTGLAVYDPSGDFVVLSAALLMVAPSAAFRSASRRASPW